MARQRTTPLTSRRSAIPPGGLFAEFARRHDWPVGIAHVMLEGDTDEGYFRIADDLYARKFNRRLLGGGFTAFAVGHGSAGGTHAMRQRFLAIRDVIECDPVNAAGEPIRAICLVDNDHAGREFINLVAGVGLREYRDVLRLHRKMPNTDKPYEFPALLKKLNPIVMDCEIEDLVHPDILDVFLEDNPGALERPPTVHGSVRHYEFNPGYKGRLVKFVGEIAKLEEMEGIVGLIQSLRAIFGLPPDCPAT